jgi:hypothetical protein
MTKTGYKNGHSAEVCMRLLLDGHSLRIAQLGPDFLILREPTEHPPANAEITLAVDGKEERWLVHLPEGIRREHRRIPVSKI